MSERWNSRVQGHSAMMPLGTPGSVPSQSSSEWLPYAAATAAATNGRPERASA